MQQALWQQRAPQEYLPLAADRLVFQRPELQSLQEGVRELSTGWMSLTVEKACWEWSWCPAALIREVKVSLRPGLRADPRSAFYPLPAAVLRVISFRPA
jgi:hypothetical protein